MVMIISGEVTAEVTVAASAAAAGRDLHNLKGHLWPRFGRMGGGFSRRCQCPLQTHIHTHKHPEGGGAFIVSNVFL